MVYGLPNGCCFDMTLLSGNLALSRALGDFQFKQNSSLSLEAQIMTADPEVTCHEMKRTSS